MAARQFQAGNGRTVKVRNVRYLIVHFIGGLRLYQLTSPQFFTSISRNKSMNVQLPGSTRWVSVLCFYVLLGSFTEPRAQQTIFNVPSSDILGKERVYGELDVTFKTSDDPRNVLPRFSSFVPRIVVGVGGRVEVGLNLTGIVNPGPDSLTLVPTIKYKAYDGGDNGWAVVVGDNVFVPVRNKSYRLGNYFYAQVSKSFESKTRVTVGAYHFSANVVAAGAQRAGGQFGFEQPITSKFELAADWYTGQHAGGYFTPGMILKPHSRLTVYVGYSLGNSNLTNGNHYSLLELGFNFN